MFRIKNILRRSAAPIIIVLIILCTDVFGAVRIIEAGQIRPRIRLYNGPIITGSDSLIADGIPLQRDSDYTIDYMEGTVNLSAVDIQFQKLEIHYTPLPSWLKKHYGIRPGVIDRPMPPSRPIAGEAVAPVRTGRAESMSIRGAKKFSITSQSGGTSQFNQELELTVKGEISPGLQVSGSVADRGYDPSYGTINSSISELDKLNLKISSRTFQSEIGHLEYGRSSDYGSSQIKQVSGIKAAYSGKWYDFSALFGRPRGKFKTVKFQGQDRVQGPYRISADNMVEAIVPGSENIWADGRLLERGADKDYIMDYPAAMVTFTPRILIDSRSRIEIDFEPLTSNFQREIYQAAGGAAWGDSLISFKIGFLREGDDRDRLKTGELSPDDLEILQSIGDSVLLSYKNGAVPDSNGAYIERFDSTGYRYFEYARDSLGDYRVSFSPVGDGFGDYLFDGNDVYRYVGQNLGDYLPVITVPVPEREDYFESELGFRPGAAGRLNLIMRQSRFDRNLYSTRDDNNNSGGQYLVKVGVGGIPTAFSERSGVEFSANIINKNFKFRTRRNRPDQARRYLIPDNLTPSGDEREYQLASALIVPGPYNALVSSGLLDYTGQFNSYYGAVTITPDLKNSLLPSLTYSRLKADYDSAGIKLDGKNEIYRAGINYDINDKTDFGGSFRHDRRWNHYFQELQGTTEKTIDVAVRYGPVRIKYEHNDEDTLLTDWTDLLTRHQATLNLTGKIGSVNSELYLTGRKSDQAGLTEEQFMARVKMTYAPAMRNLVISGSYALSDENRFERGVRYVEVEPGEGQYIYIDSQYIPDPDGNYIEVEEIHSTQANVNSGEKSFQLNYNPHDVYLKLTANSIEELLDEGDRNLLWLMPFYSDGDQPYLLRRLFYNGELRLVSYSGYYLANLTSSYNYESRRIGGTDFEKYDATAKIAFNESSDDWRFIQEGVYFKNVSDSYYSSPGDIDGFKVQLNIIKRFAGGQINGSAAYRYAEDIDGSNSRQYIAAVNPRLRIIAGGETSLKLEGYWQELNAPGFVSYRLIDNRYGEKGVNWSIRSDYRIKKDLKINVSFSGRHSDGRKPRITGRGEVIASF